MAAAAARAQERPKAKETRLMNRNVKQVCEELDHIDELFRDVLNVCSLVINRYTLSCKHFLPRPRASDSVIVYKYVTHHARALINMTWRKGGTL